MLSSEAALRIDRPLEREMAAPAQVVIGIDAPGGGNVVEDDKFDVVRGDRVVAGRLFLVLVSQANAQIANDDVRSPAQLERMILETDAIPRGRLAGDREIGILHHQVALQLDGAGEIEDDGARSRGAADALSQRSRARVAEIGDVIDVAAATAFGEPAEPLGRSGTPALQILLRDAGCRRWSREESSPARIELRTGSDASFHLEPTNSGATAS